MKSGTGHQSGHTSTGHVCSAHQRNFPDPALLCTPVPHVPPVFTASASTLLPSLQMHCSIVRLGPLTEPMEVPQNIPVPRVQALAQIGKFDYAIGVCTQIILHACKECHRLLIMHPFILIVVFPSAMMVFFMTCVPRAICSAAIF